MQESSNRIHKPESGGRKINRSTALLGSVLFMASVFFIFAAAPAADNPAPFIVEKLIGKKAPDFILKDMEGKPSSLSASKGKVVLLFFWASWCPTVREEFISLNKLYALYKDRGLVILAVSSDKSLAVAKDFVSKNPVNFQVLHDETLTVSKQLYRAFMIPTTFVIDKNGVILKKHFGEQNWTRPEILKEIDALL
jgi:peroxiredoxin